jgi:fused signal recognition particle receptor
MLSLLRDNSRSEKTIRAAEKTRQTWFGHITSLLNRSSINEIPWTEIEELLIAADVGLTTTELLIDRTKEGLRQNKLSHPDDAIDVLKNEMVTLLTIDRPIKMSGAHTKPTALLFVGVNGAGKTTSIAKLARLYTDEGNKVILGAADTFRAAAIEQLQSWGNRLKVDVIAHQSGADPGAVAFDTLEAARSRHADIVIIDTAGRLHTKSNLMEEVKKIRRVLSKRDDVVQSVLLTLEATTGQNGLLQAKVFSEAMSCDGVFLTKLDGTAKGGIVLAIAHDLNLPVLFIGTGENLDDIGAFHPRQFVEALFNSKTTT